MKSKIALLMIAVVSAFLLLPGLLLADEPSSNGAPEGGGDVQTCSDEQYEADRTERPGYWADFAYAGEVRPDRVVDEEESSQSPQDQFSGLYVLGCDQVLSGTQSAVGQYHSDLGAHLGVQFSGTGVEQRGDVLMWRQLASSPDEESRQQRRNSHFRRWLETLITAGRTLGQRRGSAVSSRGC